LRRGDLLVRQGGDQFVALCPGIDADAAGRMGERIVGVVGEPIEIPGGGTVVLRAELSVVLSDPRQARLVPVPDVPEALGVPVDESA